jgi:hypothetical protein
MEYRGHEHGRELLFDGLWLPKLTRTYRLPQVVIEHEHLTSDHEIFYDLRKVMMAWAPVRVIGATAQASIPCPSALLNEALGWLLSNRQLPAPLNERDVVRLVQHRIAHMIERNALPYRVVSEWPVKVPPPDGAQRWQIDFVILPVDGDTAIALAAEFKFSPAPERFPVEQRRTKFPVVDGRELCADIARMATLAQGNLASEAVAVFIDEGGLECSRHEAKYREAAAAHSVDFTRRSYGGDPGYTVLIASAGASVPIMAD